MIKDREKGFAHLAIILTIITVLAAVGFGAWYVWQRNKKDNQADTTNSSQNNANQNAEEQTQPKEEDKYLVIKEWGVKLRLTDDIVGAYYEFRRDEIVDYINIFDSGFDKLKNANGISCGDSHRYQFYSISRAKVADVPGLEDPDSPTFHGAGPDYKKFPFSNEYEFGGLEAHQAPPYCVGLNKDPYGPFQEDSQILEIADRKERAFDKAFDNLESVN